MIFKRLLGVNVTLIDTFPPFVSTHGATEHPFTSTSLITILVEPIHKDEKEMLNEI